MNAEVQPEVDAGAASTHLKRGGIVGQTAVLATISVLSPAMGLLSEMALAWRFGRSGVVDAYRITILLLIYGQQLFVTSILPFVIVPIFAECRAKGEEKDAWIGVESISRLLVAFGVLIAAFLFLQPELTVNIVAPGLSGEVRSTALFFVRWSGLAFIPLCWTGAASGILYAHNIFHLGPTAQLVSNLIMVLAIVLGGAKWGATSLIVGVWAGALASTAMYSIRVFALRRQIGREPVSKGIDLKALRKAFRLAAPLLGSLIVGQSTSIVIARALSRLPAGSIAVYSYAFKMSGLVQVLPNSLTTVLFPAFSATWYSKTPQEFAASCVKSLRAALFIAVPLTCVAYVLRRPLVTLLLQRGAFTSADGHATAVLFGLLILNAPAIIVSAAVSRMFYALQETRLPVITDLVGNSLEIAFIPLLAIAYGINGVAFSYMLLPWITGVGLLGIFKHRIKGFRLDQVAVFALWTVLAALPSAWLGAQFGSFVESHSPAGLLSVCCAIGSAACLALVIFFTVTSLMKLPEALATRGYLVQLSTHMIQLVKLRGTRTA